MAVMDDLEELNKKGQDLKREMNYHIEELRELDRILENLHGEMRAHSSLLQEQGFSEWLRQIEYIQQRIKQAGIAMSHSF